METEGSIRLLVNFMDEEIVSSSVKIRRSYINNITYIEDKLIYIKKTMSGSFTPYVKIYDKYYFTPNAEPYQARYEFDRSLHEEGFECVLDVSTFDTYLKNIEDRQEFNKDLEYEKIIIIEKED